MHVTSCAAVKTATAPGRENPSLDTTTQIQNKSASYRFLSSLCSHSTRGSGLTLHLLHFLRDFQVDLEELGHAAVNADGLALVQVAFQISWGNALLHAGVGEAGWSRKQGR